MFAAENLRDWLGHTVIDPEGNKIGTLEAVYVDTTSDEPSFVTVRIGMISRHRLAFVPVTGATVSPKAVRVQYPKKLVQDARRSTPTESWPPQLNRRRSRTTTLTMAAGRNGG
ncbi:MAG: PRC-barrel domain-containing protein [Pseudonocardiaceae bacterium]